jgi:hypothetical protein
VVKNVNIEELGVNYKEGMLNNDVSIDQDSFAGLDLDHQRPDENPLLIEHVNAVSLRPHEHGLPCELTADTVSLSHPLEAATRA